MADITYYYIKQQTDYYAVGVPKLIGKNYLFQVIYNKLILLSVEGKGLITNDTKLEFFLWLSSLLDETESDIKKCVEFLANVNGVEQVAENQLKIIGIDKLTGSRTSSAIKKEKQRQKAKGQAENEDTSELDKLGLPKVDSKQVAEWFKEFYNAYPRKESRQYALETFKDKFKCETQETAERRFKGIMARLNEYIEQCEQDGTERQFIKCAHTFLKAELQDSTVESVLERLNKNKVE